METITFEEVSIHRCKSGKCRTCGKRRKRTKKFFQTLNPFNKKPAFAANSNNASLKYAKEQLEQAIAKAKPEGQK